MKEQVPKKYLSNIICIDKLTNLKGSMSRDFLPILFYSNPSGPLINIFYISLFKFGFDFAEIFEFF